MNTESDTPIHPSIKHEHLLRILVSRPTDYTDYGGEVVRWANENEAYPDCSGGCIWAAWLSGEIGSDWCVCTKPDSPRTGLLTFEHQAGKGCFADEKTLLKDLRDMATGWTWWSTLTEAQKADRVRLVANCSIVKTY